MARSVRPSASVATPATAPSSRARVPRSRGTAGRRKWSSPPCAGTCATASRQRMCATCWRSAASMSPPGRSCIGCSNLVLEKPAGTIGRLDRRRDRGGHPRPAPICARTPLTPIAAVRIARLHARRDRPGLVPTAITSFSGRTGSRYPCLGWHALTSPAKGARSRLSRPRRALSHRQRSQRSSHRPYGR